MTNLSNFLDYEYSYRKRLTKRNRFLDCIADLTPRDYTIELIKPY